MDQNNDFSGVKFEEDKWKQSTQSFQDKTPKIVQLVMQWSGGAIKNERQAEYVLFGFVVLAIIVSLFLFFGVGGGRTPSVNSITTEDVLPR